MNLKEVEKTVGKIQRSLFKNANAYSTGMLKSHFRGSGLQFKEHQVYSPGDEVRFIDWKLSAKTSNTYIKTFEEERNVEINVILDINPAMFLGFNGISKLQVALEIACLFYLLAEETKDKVKIIIITDKVFATSGKSGRLGITEFLYLLQNENILNKDGKINLNYALEKSQLPKSERLRNLKMHLAKRKEVVILSDFSDFLDLDDLKNLVYRKHFHCFRILCPLDKNSKMPFSVIGKGIRNNQLINIFTDSFESKHDEVKELLGGKIKDLNVDERYLDEFVKHMM